jgi:hypothetical protein
MKIHKYKDYELWYDRTTRCWFAAKFDSNGYQIGDAIDAYTKQELISWIDVIS